MELIEHYHSWSVCSFVCMLSVENVYFHLLYFHCKVCYSRVFTWFYFSWNNLPCCIPATLDNMWTSHSVHVLSSRIPHYIRLFWDTNVTTLVIFDDTLQGTNISPTNPHLSRWFSSSRLVGYSMLIFVEENSLHLIRMLFQAISIAVSGSLHRW